MVDDDMYSGMINFIKLVNKRENLIRLGIDDPYAWEFLKIRVENEDIRGNNDQNCEIGNRPENMRKNRYRDILPYDHTRVKITPYADDTNSDYINASLIKGANNNIGYIATQGPMPETVADFWQMIAEFGVKTVLMLCDLFEAGKAKCYQYWPEVGSSAEYHHVTVANTYEESPQSHFTVRHFTLNCYGKTTQLRQFHYHGWPDHGTPDEIHPLLEFLLAVRSWQEPNDLEPLVVHCSAGCGRSGTFCALDYVSTQIKNKNIPKHFSVCGIVNELRKQRIAMVQSKDQYVLLHQAVELLFRDHLILSESCTEEKLNTLIAEPEEVSGDQSRSVQLNGHKNAETVTPTGKDQPIETENCGTKEPNGNPTRSRKAALTSSTLQKGHAPHSESCSSVVLSEVDEASSLTKNASSSSVFTHTSNNNSRASSPDRATAAAAVCTAMPVDTPSNGVFCADFVPTADDIDAQQDGSNEIFDSTLTPEHDAMLMKESGQIKESTSHEAPTSSADVAQNDGETNRDCPSQTDVRHCDASPKDFEETNKPPCSPCTDVSKL